MKEYIKVDDLEFPKLFGERGEISHTDSFNLHCGCAVITKLINDEHLQIGFEWGNNTALHSIISNVTEEQLQLCRQSRLCGPLIDKMQNHQYSYNADRVIDNICVHQEEDRYVPFEGKHRACIAKNFLDKDDIISVDVNMARRLSAILHRGDYLGTTDAKKTKKLLKAIKERFLQSHIYSRFQENRKS